MRAWHLFKYRTWRAVGSLAFGLYHRSAQWSHEAFVRAGKND